MYLNELINIYKKSKICLFTGAGLSFTSTAKYQTPGWWKLLELIYDNGYDEFSIGQNWKSFAEIKEASKDPWKVVDMIIRLFGSEDRFQKILIRSLIQETGRDKRYKRLPISYLNNAPTLNSAIAFCSKIKYFDKHQCLKPNDKIRAILTLNYDWYFEGGATQKFNAAPFKPMVDDKSEESEGKLLVYHLHGYIPHRNTSRMRRPLTMSTNSYQELYSKEGTWVKSIIKSHLNHNTTLFIGVSFDDTLLVNYLQRLADCTEWPYHFFLAKEGTFDTAKLKKLEKANIHPIWIKDFDEIPKTLMKIYSEGIDLDDLKVWYRREKVFRTLELEEYWPLLLLNKK